MEQAQAGGGDGAALAIRDDLSAVELRRHARCEPNQRAALPMLERQALRDAVVRDNAEGLADLYDRPKPGRSQRLSEAGQAALAAHIFRGLDPEKDGVSAWTWVDLCRWLEARLGKAFHPASLSRVLKRLDLSRQKTRPVHPQADPRAQARFRKRGRARP